MTTLDPARSMRRVAIIAASRRLAREAERRRLVLIQRRRLT